MHFCFTDIVVLYIDVHYDVFIYILLLLSCFGCSLYIFFYQALYNRHSILTIQLSHSHIKPTHDKSVWNIELT